MAEKGLREAGNPVPMADPDFHPWLLGHGERSEGREGCRQAVGREGQNKKPESANLRLRKDVVG